jgi:hypothetical protein
MVKAMPILALSYRKQIMWNYDHSHKTANGRYVSLGQRVKTSQAINSDIGIIKRIDSENETVFIVPVTGAYAGGWYTISTIFSFN